MMICHWFYGLKIFVPFFRPAHPHNYWRYPDALHKGVVIGVSSGRFYQESKALEERPICEDLYLEGLVPSGTR